MVASMAQLAERSAVNRQVLGSIPSGGVFLPNVKCAYLLVPILRDIIYETVLTCALSVKGLVV